MSLVYVFVGAAVLAVIYRLGYMVERSNGHYEANCKLGETIARQYEQERTKPKRVIGHAVHFVTDQRAKS